MFLLVALVAVAISAVVVIGLFPPTQLLPTIGIGTGTGKGRFHIVLDIFVIPRQSFTLGNLAQSTKIKGPVLVGCILDAEIGRATTMIDKATVGKSTWT